MKKAILFILILILFFMPLQNWEGLQKSATDDETIEQAIARLIAVHEGDATSHLGVGESLQAHKNADVIDHPAQSIVSDKELFGLYNEIVQIIAGSIWSAEVGSISQVNGRHVSAFLFSQTAVNAVCSLPMATSGAYPNADLLYTFRLRMNGAQLSDGQLKLFWAIDNDPGNTERVEFVKDGTAYYFRIYVGGSKVHQYLLQTGGEMVKFVGVYFNSVNASIDLFVDGVQVSSYETADWHDLIFDSFSIDATRTTNTSISVSILFWKARYTFFIL